MIRAIARRCLQKYFDRTDLLFSPAHLPPANFYVDMECGVHYGSIPAEACAPEHLISAWVLTDITLECMTGEPSRLGFKTLERLADAAGINDFEARYVRLRQSLAPMARQFVRDIAYRNLEDTKQRADQLRRSDDARS